MHLYMYIHILAVEVSNLYISSNENDSCYSAQMTFPGNMKGVVTLLRPFFFTDSS